MADNRVRINVMVDPATAERIRDAAYWTEGETVSSLVERGALEWVARLEKRRGAAFPPREGEVKTGRPSKKT